jgi:hypothetical protein
MSQLSFPETAEQTHLSQIPEEGIQNPHYQEYLKLSQKEWMFADLLSMNRDKTILTNSEHKIKVLNLLYHCYQSGSKALKAFYVERNLELFDAHVGESACQIRATKLAVMLQNISEKDTQEACLQIQRYETMARHIAGIIQQYQASLMGMDGSLLVCDFLKKYNLDCSIKRDHLFLVVSFILSAFKKRMAIDMQTIDLYLLSNFWSISRNSSEIFINHIQKIGSLLSVDYVLSQITSERLDTKLLLYQLQKDHIGRWILPCLETIRFMLGLMRTNQISALVQVFIERRDGFKLTYQYLCRNNFFLSIKTA